MHCVSESPYNIEKWCENEVIQVFNTINNNILMAKLERYSYSCSATSLKVRPFSACFSRFSQIAPNAPKNHIYAMNHWKYLGSISF